MVVNAVLRELGQSFEVAESSYPLFVDGRCAVILVNGETIGTFGEIYPDILTGHKLVYPVAAFEFRI
jgi:phenylalanyl-tRNA synthetase beta chain